MSAATTTSRFFARTMKVTRRQATFDAHLVRLEGVFRETDVGDWLEPLIADVHFQAAREGLREVVLDITQLEYANAAFWTSLVSWIKRMRADADTSYTLRIKTEPKHRWQQIGMPMLRIFGAERLEVA